MSRSNRPAKYVCELCKKEFHQKIDFVRHTKNKKTPCISLAELEKIHASHNKRQTQKGELVNAFKYCFDVMRPEGVTGADALLNLAYLLVLKMIEPHIGTEIDIDGYEYDWEDHFADVEVEEAKTRLPLLVRFSNLAKEKEDNLPMLLKCIWDIILSEHPSTKRVFLKNKGFDIGKQNPKIFKVLIDKLVSLDLIHCEHDVLGDAYEEFVSDAMAKNDLGQFFTPTAIKQMMVKLVDPKIHADGTIDTCCDPTMGTGGFLISYLNHIFHQAKTKGIAPNMEFIRTQGVYGKEIHTNTFQLAMSNMLISSGHTFHNLENGDSLRVPITRKFDTVLANPPFGIKTLKYDDIKCELKEEYMPIMSDNAVTLFLQAIIYMLKHNGKCAVVLPNGNDLFSKSGDRRDVREYLMKTCDLKEVIYLPQKVFTNTSIKTCVLYFVKKREGTQVMKTTVKVTKTQKEKGREYAFSEVHQTHKVRFYNWNAESDEKTLIAEASMDQIAANGYSLNASEYVVSIQSSAIAETIGKGIVVKQLKDVCNITFGTRIVKNKSERGKYPVYGGGSATFTTNTYNREGYNVLIGRFAISAECVRITNEPLYLNDSGMSIAPIDNTCVLHKYIGYYMLHNQQLVFACARGTGQQNIEMETFESLHIPIPPMDVQKEIVEYLDFIYETVNKTTQAKIDECKQLNERCVKMQCQFGENVVKPLGEVCTFKNGKGVKKADLIEGNYPVIGGGQSPLGYHNQFNTEENTILCSSSGAYSGFISKYPSKVWASDCFAIIPKDTLVLNNNYLFQVLKQMQQLIYATQTGAAQPHVYSSTVCNLNIPIPSLERQKEIVAYCEQNEALICELTKELKRNQKMASDFFKRAIHTSASSSDHVNEVPTITTNVDTNGDANADADANCVVSEASEATHETSETLTVQSVDASVVVPPLRRRVRRIVHKPQETMNA